MRWPTDPDQRRRLADALLDWVAALEEAEPVPEGLTPEARAEPPDIYTALGEVEALRREIALQGRTFARLAETSKGTSEQVETLVEKDERAEVVRLDEARTTARREARREALREGRLTVIEGLLETREGLKRSLETAGQVRARFVGRWFGAKTRNDAFAALEKALELNLDRADAALRDLDVREWQCVGDAFDPVTMRAVEAADSEEGKPGTVVAVRRPGWMEGDQVLRPAEVRAVPARAATDEDRSDT